LSDKDVPSEADPLEGVLNAVVRLVADVRRRQAAITQEHGVTMLQSQAIHALRQQGPLNITQLAQALHLNQSTVSSLADRMERDGLVRRVQSSQDRRSVKLRLTEKSDDIAVQLPVSPLGFFRDLLAQALSAEEQATLARLLQKISKRIYERFGEIDAARAKAAQKHKAG